MTLADLIGALEQPTAYPHPVEEVRVHRTHISVVFLAGDFAYKVKKPIELEFLDYGTLERRRHFCEEEVRLNRRLAPEVYLGVVPIVRGDDGLEVEIDDGGRDDEEPAVGGGREVVEWAVRMRRLPTDRTLQSLLERGTVEVEDVVGVANHLADFHGRAARGPEISRYGSFETVAGNARDNLTQSRDQVGATIHPDVFERLSRGVEAALEERRGLIERRAERDVPCDTHGDLRLDHVYFLPDHEQPVIVDCIEFNPAFRFADPVADTAFLAMDLAQAGRRDLAGSFADAYFRAADDEEGRELLSFYVSYRAAVRGKVQGIKAAEGDVPEEERREAARTARGHWLLALETLEAAGERPGLVLVGGLPASGKTTLARALAEAAGFTVVRSDVVRKELAGLEPDDPSAAAWESGLYSREWSDRTYEECRRRAERALFRGERVVVDASFHDEAQRRAFLETAVRHGARARLLLCEAGPEVVGERLAARAADASDADWDIYDRMRERWEPPGQDTARFTATVSTAGAIEATVAAALEELRSAGLA